MVRHVFLIATQELPDTSQLETQIAIRLVWLGWAAAVCGFRLKLPLGLSRVYTLDEGREEGRIVVVDQGYGAVEDSLVQLGTLCPSPDLAFDFFVRPVLGNEVLKLKPQN